MSGKNRTEGDAISSRVAERLREMDEPYVEAPNDELGTIVGCVTIDKYTLFCRFGCDTMHQYCPKCTDGLPEGIARTIRAVYPCPECGSNNIRKMLGVDMDECRQCGHEWNPREDDEDDDEKRMPMAIRPIQNDEGDDYEFLGDEDNDGLANVGVRVDDDVVVIEGNGYDTFNQLQSRLRDSAAYFYDPENDEWSISIKGRYERDD